MDGFFSIEMLRAIENEIEWEDLQRGATLYREGEPSDALHVLIHGRLVVTMRDEHGVEQPIRTVGRGGIIPLVGIAGETTAIAVVVRRTFIPPLMKPTAYERRRRQLRHDTPRCPEPL